MPDNLVQLLSGVNDAMVADSPQLRVPDLRAAAALRRSGYVDPRGYRTTRIYDPSLKGLGLTVTSSEPPEDEPSVLPQVAVGAAVLGAVLFLFKGKKRKRAAVDLFALADRRHRPVARRHHKAKKHRAARRR